MKRTMITFVGAVVVEMVVAGCGNSAPKMTAAEKSVFEKSTPEIKQLFEKAQAADKANDYFSACTNYYAVMHQNLTMDQAMAMQTAMVALKQRVFDAADKGDAGAKTTLEFMKANNARQSR